LGGGKIHKKGRKNKQNAKIPLCDKGSFGDGKQNQTGDRQQKGTKEKETSADRSEQDTAKPPLSSKRDKDSERGEHDRKITNSTSQRTRKHEMRVKWGSELSETRKNSKIKRKAKRQRKNRGCARGKFSRKSDRVRK